MMTRTLVAVSLIFATAAAARADVIANYTFDSGSAASSDSNANSTASNVSLYNLVPQESAASSDIGISSASSMFILYTQATGSTQAEALADDDYFSFTVSAVPGNVLNLTSLTFDLGGSANAVTTFYDTVYVQDNVDGIGASDPVLASRTATVASHDRSGPPILSAAASIDLTDARFQGLTSITFHFSFADTTDASYIDRLDNIVLNGTTAAPAAVPSPAALPAGLALLGLAGLRRPRRSRITMNVPVSRRS